MANSPSPALGDRERLELLARSRTCEAGAVLRARIVLATVDGTANDRIAQQLQVSKNTVLTWRRRYAERGMAGLVDAPRSGRPRRLDHRQIVATMLKPPPKKYGVRHWSSRLLAAHLGVGNATIARAWREYGVQPCRSGTFTFSIDPELVVKVTDIVGLYLAPSENAVVLCVDEKSQIQALEEVSGGLCKWEGSFAEGD